MRVKPLLLASLATSLALLAGCSKKDKNTAPPAPASPARGSDGTSGSAPFGIPLYTPEKDVPGPIRGAIADDDRTDKDRALDAGRKPGEVLAFFKVAPGQKIGELFAGPGYTTELLARTLGENGKLYAQNTKEVLDRFARKPLSERLAKPALKNTTMLEQPADAPFPPEVKDLDAVICILNYHDFVWQKVDRAKLNAAVFAALKPGGIYGIVDHSAAKGSGLRDVETLHRIDEEAVKQEITAAGFKLDGESEVLRNPADPRDWNASPKAASDANKRGTSDRFVLRFVKP
jgi:predicted methyltransferase